MWYREKLNSLNNAWNSSLSQFFDIRVCCGIWEEQWILPAQWFLQEDFG